MKMKIIIRKCAILMTFLIMIGSITTIASSPKGWKVTFGGEDLDEGLCVQQTNDGGYIIAGETYSYGAGFSDLWLVKTDNEGNKEWDKTIGGENGYDYGASIQQTSDGGYIVAGCTDSFNVDWWDGWLVKTDSNGNKEWDKTFQKYDFIDHFTSVQQTSDGGYIVTGSTSEWLGDHHEAWLIKTDSNGDIIWDKTYSGYEGNSVQQTSDGGYIVTGEKGDYLWLLKTDSNGDQIWATSKYLKDHSCVGMSVQQTSDGGYIVAGYADRGTFLKRGDALLLKSDSNGHIEWCKTFRGSFLETEGDYLSEAYSVQETNDEGYIITGYVDLKYKEFDGKYWTKYTTDHVWLIKTDKNGRIQWDRTFGGGKDDDVGRSVQQTSDGGYIIAGYTESYGAGKTDFWLIKTDKNGESNSRFRGSDIPRTRSTRTMLSFKIFENYPRLNVLFNLLLQRLMYQKILNL